MHPHNTRPDIIDKEPDTKTGVAFRPATIRRAWGSQYDNGQGSLLAPATQGTQLSTAGKPAASWILDSVGNVLLGGAAVVGNSQWGANTSSTTNVNLQSDQRKAFSFSFIEVRTLAIAAAVVAVIVALFLLFRRK